jgi:hypothetical protein
MGKGDILAHNTKGVPMELLLYYVLIVSLLEIGSPGNVLSHTG